MKRNGHEKICFAKNARFSRNHFSFSLEALDEILQTFQIFETINSVRSNISLKCQRFAPSGCKDIGIRKFKLCGKDSTPFLLKSHEWKLCKMLSYFYIIILGQSNCDYSPQTRDQYIIYTDKSLSSFSSASCKQSCTQERDFNCRSYSFLSETRSGDPQCLLSSDTQKSAGGKFKYYRLE